MRNALVVSFPLTMALAAGAFAAPFGDAGRGFRDGANHHLGDAGFVSHVGRTPTHRDDEKVRMKTHLQHVRALLASNPATQPALAAKRTELLGFLDDYIAKGTTPMNEHLPWRTPVFIDDHGNICAVGYLIERSVGRALPERIAKSHRYEFLEDIARALPEVRDWVAASGLTLDELASIQPGYSEPVIEGWGRVDYVAFKMPDGEYTDSKAAGETKGTLKKGHMEGTWTRTIDAKLAGKGEMTRGRGTWTSFYPDGKKLAIGPFTNDNPNGAWTFFHPSGNVAASGTFRAGHRDGAWQFFNDRPNKPLLASGQFSNGSTYGTWRHYDGDGKLLAVSRPAGSGNDPMSRGGVLLTIVPGKDRVQHEVHSFGGMDNNQIHTVAIGNERLYLQLGGPIYDASGNLLTKTSDGWSAADCKWGAKRKAIAKNGDVTTMHRLIYRTDEKTCVDPKPVSAARATAIATTLGVLANVRAPSPAFVKKLALGDANIKYGDVLDPTAVADDTEKTEDTESANADDLARILAVSLGWYVEWPHIDGRFAQVFPTIAGHWSKNDIQTKKYEIENPES